jgi:hypothetical protein
MVTTVLRGAKGVTILTRKIEPRKTNVNRALRGGTIQRRAAGRAQRPGQASAAVAAFGIRRQAVIAPAYHPDALPLPPCLGCKDMA